MNFSKREVHLSKTQSFLLGSSQTGSFIILSVLNNCNWRDLLSSICFTMSNLSLPHIQSKFNNSSHMFTTLFCYIYMNEK